MDVKDIQVEERIENIDVSTNDAAVRKAQNIYAHGQDVALPTEDMPWKQYVWKQRVLIFRSAIVYLAVLNVGFDLSVTGTTLGMPSFRKYFGSPDPKKAGDYIIPAVYQSAWNGGNFGGQVATDLLAGWLADRIGRKWTLILSVCVIIIASTIQVTAHNVGQIIAGKTVFGMDVGLYISFVTSHIAKLAPSRLRGVACMSVNFCIQISQWLGSGAALGLVETSPDIDETQSFQIVFCLQYIFATLFLIFVHSLPESPTFHIHREEYEKAEKVIRVMYGEEYNCQRHVAFLTNKALAERKMRKVGKSISYLEMFKGRNLVRLFISACIIWPILMGTSFWPAYQTYYFELAGANNPQAMNYSCTTVAIATSLIAYTLIETVGRRRL